MENIERRLSRLEDRLVPKDIIGPSPTETVSDEWVKEFGTHLNEFVSRYTPEQLKAYETKLTEAVKGVESERARAKNQTA